MRNYVIINGVNSLNIQGLAINQLPPISKPAQRVLKEEIDGRNGDIITPLGYSSYDKVMTIGLFGDYNIDDIISFFNQKGYITFSNEDDKKYKFEIINQIDYESLLKFRTASITLHCQPFKYPLSETPISITSTGNITTGGNIFSCPTLSIEGTGTIEIGLNGNQIFEIDLSDTDKIVIDTDKLEAYNPDTLELMNRDVIGDYDNFRLTPPTNQISINGNLTSLVITNHTRWI